MSHNGMTYFLAPMDVEGTLEARFENKKLHDRTVKEQEEFKQSIRLIYESLLRELIHGGIRRHTENAIPSHDHVSHAGRLKCGTSSYGLAAGSAEAVVSKSWYTTLRHLPVKKETGAEIRCDRNQS